MGAESIKTSLLQKRSSRQESEEDELNRRKAEILAELESIEAELEVEDSKEFDGTLRSKEFGSQKTVATAGSCSGSGPIPVPSCYKGDIFGIVTIKAAIATPGKMIVNFDGAGETGCAEIDFVQDGQDITGTFVGCNGSPLPPAEFSFKYCS